MLVVIDVGNTNMVFGIFNGEELLGSFRLKTDVNRTSDEIGLLACEYFRRFGLESIAVEDVIIASVAPPVMHSLTNAVIKYFDKIPLVVDDGVDPGLPYGVPGDERLGADRAMACVAAIEKYGAPLVVLDFGTATTVDALSEGGASTWAAASPPACASPPRPCFRRRPTLPNVELAMPDKVLGCTAVSQIQAGAVGGYIGSMEYLIRRAKAEMGYPGDAVKVVATGGLSRMVAQNTRP